MPRSLSLAAYRAVARRTEAASYTPPEARPTGEILWIHAAEANGIDAAIDLAERLIHQRFGLYVLVTSPELGTHFSRPKQTRIIFAPPPSEAPTACASFIAHWRPNCGLWLWGGLRPNLVVAADDAGCPLILADADAGGFDGRRNHWLPDVTRQVLGKFRAAFARSHPAGARLIRLGLPASDVSILSPLRAGGRILPCAESDIRTFSEILSGRPVWFAACVQTAEIASVLRAHRKASKHAHRLLLILHVADQTRVAAANETAIQQGFRTADWAQGHEPTEATQILIAGDPDDTGLFFRVAPLSFLGSSLIPGHGGLDPFDAAVLGSAVLYGPNVGKYLPYYTRLAQAGAARIVNDGETLGTAVTQLIAPDQAAAMAHAGWDVISEGATATDKVIELVHDLLDNPSGNLS